MIALIGAAGNVGSKVADLLLRRNEDVRVLEHARSLDALRERGADVVKGDVVDVEDLRTLFAGASAAFVLLPENMADPQFVRTRSSICRALARALRDRPVGHVVALSSVGADRPGVPGPPAGLHELEQRLSELDETNLLVLRSVSYMDYLLANLPLIRSERINGSVVKGDLKVPMIATQDVAREAAERLMRRDFAGHQVKLLRGPEDVSMEEATRAMSERLGLHDVRYVELAPAQMKGALLAAGMSDEAASLLVEMQVALNEGRFSNGVQRTPETTTPTRLDEFLTDALPG